MGLTLREHPLGSQICLAIDSPTVSRPGMCLHSRHTEVNVTWKVPVAFRESLRIEVDKSEPKGQMLHAHYYCK